MRDVWHLSTDDESERRLFASLDAVLALPSTPAGPKNRFRHVERIALPSGVYYLKTFTRTQWKNRWWFHVTAPRVRDDAERELRVIDALRHARIGAPRPIAYGRRGESALLLVAALSGRACDELARAGAADGRLLRRVAEHCGRILAAGFWLPDLGADHVFADGSNGDGALAVLDLHNGRIATAGPPPRRICKRVLRRFARSVRDVPVTWPQALGFAVRLLRTAGHRGAAARTILARLSPFATAARYEVAAKSAAYADRNPRRTQRELELLRRVWPGNAGEVVLDLPCGAGRLSPLLTGPFAHRVVQADGAFAMLRHAIARRRAPLAPEAVQADALSMPFADGAVDGVVMFRFLHHLPPDARRRAIAEACRTARRFVVASFFHPCSAHHVRRRLRQLGGGAPTRFAVTLRTLATDFARHGFALHTRAADLPFARDLWVASFVRRDARSGEAPPRAVRSAP